MCCDTSEYEGNDVHVYLHMNWMMDFTKGILRLTVSHCAMCTYSKSHTQIQLHQKPELKSYFNRTIYLRFLAE